MNKNTQMYIEMRENECSLFAGQYIHARVHLTECVISPANGLTITLHGFEEVTMKRKHKNTIAPGNTKLYDLEQF